MTSRAASPTIEGDRGEKGIGHLASVAEHNAVLFAKCNQDDRARNPEEQPFRDGEAETAAAINEAPLPRWLEPQRSQLPWSPRSKSLPRRDARGHETDPKVVPDEHRGDAPGSLWWSRRRGRLETRPDTARTSEPAREQVRGLRRGKFPKTRVGGGIRTRRPRWCCARSWRWRGEQPGEGCYARRPSQRTATPSSSATRNSGSPVRTGQASTDAAPAAKASA